MLLDKPYDFKRTPAQQARNMQALQRLLDGDLEPGELFALVTGQAPEQFTNPAAQLVTQRACLDCGQALTSAGEPLQSQPRRCRPCGQKKRRAHNDAYQEQTKALRRKGTNGATP